MALENGWQFVYRPVTLVFRTVHWDKAGETSGLQVVAAEVADVTGDGNALLVTRDGIPLHVPVAMLFPTSSPGAAVEAQAYLCGQELIRNFHPEAGAPRTMRRWLDRQEAEALLAMAEKAEPGAAANRRV